MLGDEGAERRGVWGVSGRVTPHDSLLGTLRKLTQPPSATCLSIALSLSRDSSEFALDLDLFAFDL